MLKRFLISLFCLIGFQAFCLADETTSVQTFFNNYVNAANSYSSNLPNYYASNAKIIRRVIKSDGTKKDVVVPMQRYIKELKQSAVFAKTVGYKNKYVNQKITKSGNDYKVSTVRIPRNDKKGLNAYFIVTKTPNGYKIKEEMMETTVQKFLTAK